MDSCQLLRELVLVATPRKDATAGATFLAATPLKDCNAYGHRVLRSK